MSNCGSMAGSRLVVYAIQRDGQPFPEPLVPLTPEERGTGQMMQRLE